MTNSEIYQAIDAQFRQGFKNNKELQHIRELLRLRKADYETAQRYAELLGQTLSDAIQAVITPDVLPDGIMYEDLAREIVEKGLYKNYSLAMDYTEMMQIQKYREQGLGLKAIIPKYDAEKTDGIVTFISGLPYEEYEAQFLEAIITNTIQNVDEAIKINADFMAKSGMDVKVERVLAPAEVKTTKKGREYTIPCEMCRSVAGTYTYGDEPEYFWARHEGCRCTRLIHNTDGTTEEV